MTCKNTPLYNSTFNLFLYFILMKQANEMKLEREVA